MTEPGTDLPDTSEQSSGYPFALPRAQFAVIRKPSEHGSVVAKFDFGSDGGRLPKGIHDHDEFVVSYPGSRSALESVTIDQASANLTEAEKDLLELAGYPISV